MYDSLARDGFVDLPGISSSGVYVLVWGERIVYVGQSVNVYARICSHRNRLLRYRKGKIGHNRPEWDRVIHFDRVWVMWAAVDELDHLELETIRKYNPEVNKILRRYDIPTFEVDLNKIGLGEWTRPYNESARVLRRI